MVPGPTEPHSEGLRRRQGRRTEALGPAEYLPQVGGSGGGATAQGPPGGADPCVGEGVY